MISVLLLGSRSFIGKSILDRWQSLPSERVSIQGLSSKDLDLTDREAVDAYFRDNYFDYVILSAVQVANVENSLRMFFNVRRNTERYGFLINLGSGAEYDPVRYKPKMDEAYAAEAFPEAGYPLIKSVQGKQIESDGLQASVNFRIFGVYGKFEDFSRRFITSNVHSALTKGAVTCNQDMLFDYVHVDVLSDFLYKVIVERRTFEHKTYNFCTGSPVSLVDLGHEICRQIPRADFVLHKKGFGGEYSGDPTRLDQEFGTLSHRPFNNAIAELKLFFEDMISNGRLEEA